MMAGKVTSTYLTGRVTAGDFWGAGLSADPSGDLLVEHSSDPSGGLRVDPSSDPSGDLPARPLQFGPAGRPAPVIIFRRSQGWPYPKHRQTGM